MVFISMICVQTKTFVVSVVAQNDIMFVHGILLGGIHQESSQKTLIENGGAKLYTTVIWLCFRLICRVVFIMQPTS